MRRLSHLVGKLILFHLRGVHVVEYDGIATDAVTDLA